VTCRITRQDDGKTWVCACGWTGPGTGLQAHIGLRAATFGRDGGADWIIPEDMDRPEEEEPLHEWWTR